MRAKGGRIYVLKEGVEAVAARWNRLPAAVPVHDEIRSGGGTKATWRSHHHVQVCERGGSCVCTQLRNCVDG